MNVEKSWLNLSTNLTICWPFSHFHPGRQMVICMASNFSAFIRLICACNRFITWFGWAINWLRVMVNFTTKFFCRTRRAEAFQDYETRRQFKRSLWSHGIFELTTCSNIFVRMIWFSKMGWISRSWTEFVSAFRSSSALHVILYRILGKEYVNIRKYYNSWIIASCFLTDIKFEYGIFFPSRVSPIQNRPPVGQVNYQGIQTCWENVRKMKYIPKF